MLSTPLPKPASYKNGITYNNILIKACCKTARCLLKRKAIPRTKIKDQKRLRRIRSLKRWTWNPQQEEEAEAVDK
jgi:hypothetical protein